MLPFDISHNMTELCWEGTKERDQTGFNIIFYSFLTNMTETAVIVLIGGVESVGKMFKIALKGKF